jgi:hypothetical protein
VTSGRVHERIAVGIRHIAVGGFLAVAVAAHG